MNNDLFAGEKNPEAMETMLLSVVGSYALDTLLDAEQLRQHKEQCLERLRVQDSGKPLAHYAEQAILANLDWGMDALEEAICSSSEESRKARLQHAEKMLQVCALLDINTSTAGVPNSYLSAWAHLNLAFVWKLRNDDRNAAKHMMDMFIVDPYYARVDFAPVLWEHLFQSHLTSITAWYSDQRHNILMGDSSDGQVSCSSRDESYAAAGKNLLSNVNPEQASQLQHLENLYQDSLDDHTRRYARHYKNGLVSDSPQKWALFPIAEPPMTPLREVGTLERRLYEEPDLSPIHENRSFIHKGSTTASSGELTAQDFFLNLSCNPMWEEDESMEVSDKIDNVNMENTKFYASNVSSLQGNSSKTGIDNPWSQEEVSDTYSHPHVEQTKLKISSMRKRPKSQSPDLQEGQQQEASDCSTSLSPRDMYSHPDIRRQFPSEYSLSISSESESELEMEDAKAQPLGRTESMDSYDRRRSLSNSESSSCVRKDAKATISATALGHNLQVKTSYLEKTNLVTRAPKDFVCPITGHLFNDPVTLETGQTYERRAIQEWMDRGNSTCPITRQTLRNSSLPKTNYVLKRLVASWKEQNFEVAQELSSCSRPQTPPSVVYHSKLRRDQVSIDSPQGSPCSTSSSSSRAAQFNPRQSTDSSLESPVKTPHLGRMLNDLKQILSILCTSEDLQECEESLLIIKQIMSQAKHQHVEKYLREAGVIDSIVEVLFNSNSAEVCDAGIVVLSGLSENNDLVKDLIKKADANLECILSLLTKGVTGTVILLHQLKLPISQISKLNLLPYLIRIIKEGNTRQEPVLSMNPKTAALNMLCELVSMEDSKKNGSLVEDILSTDAMLALVQCLKEKNSDQKLKALSLLLYCIQADVECRDFLVHEANIALVLELLHCGNSTARLVAISFLSELVHQSRRIANSKILKTIKEEGMLSSMHVLLAYLQLAPLEQRPLTASLLLQLDLLEEPQKRSMYRDEAMEALIESLTNKESVVTQVIAAESLVALLGRFSTCGKPSTEEWLLKIADLGDNSNEYADAAQSCEWIEDKEEERASKIWEKRIAKALLGYEHGTILHVLSHHILSKTPELSKPSMVTAVWLLRMLPLLPDTGLRTTACNCLLNPFLYIFKASRNNEKQVLAALALQSFLDHSESVKKLASNAKEICGLLRQLQKMTWVEKEIFSVIVKDPSVNATELWVHEDIGQVDLSLNGSIRAFARARGHIFSGHSDGSIKVL
ncbi:hypothetical protein O6H91_10G078400 [Diphasiastrum complanatum]|uniref:Uncharacterized protein n=1 Tax=Diphasiastrum complanatum TaxID=34168 RepID=A0ACC2CIM6_DIPCM|nr:hypothetical protein O6H91_10G078400 [Diphasiastrum complanatum]